MALLTKKQMVELAVAMAERSIHGDKIKAILLDVQTNLSEDDVDTAMNRAAHITPIKS